MSAKRLLDVTASTLLLVATAPLWALASILIKVSSPGPVLFRQERIGWHEQPFELYKLRTMHVGSDQQLTGLVTVADDPRIFRGGNFLRTSKLDELPQLLNVLAGDMSLVGPRPTAAEDRDKMTERQRQRHDVRPGMTGLAQISGNTSLSWPERIEYDLEYVAAPTVRTDMAILWKTARMVLTGTAATDVVGDDEWAES